MQKATSSSQLAPEQKDNTTNEVVQSRAFAELIVFFSANNTKQSAPLIKLSQTARRVFQMGSDTVFADMHPVTLAAWETKTNYLFSQWAGNQKEVNNTMGSDQSKGIRNSIGSTWPTRPNLFHSFDRRVLCNLET